MVICARAAATALASLAWVACRGERPRAHSGSESASASVSAAVGRPQALPIAATSGAGGADVAPGAGSLSEGGPLIAEPLVSLDVPGFSPAVVSVPTGTTRPRPVVVALHGNYDRPEWQCEVWRRIIGVRGFILCPRGIPRRDAPRAQDRWEYGSAKVVEAEIEAGLSALRARFEPFVDPGPLLLLGFSLGAILGSPIAQQAPARYPRLVLIEGGLNRWSPSNAAAYVKGGGERLFVGCGQGGCLAQAEKLASNLEKSGLPVRFGGSARAGHTYDGPVAQAVEEGFAWLVEGDLRWEVP